MHLFKRKDSKGQDSRFWSFRHHEAGQTIRRSTGESSRKIAEAVAWQAIEEWRKKRLNKLTDPDWVDEDELNLVDLLAQWNSELESKQRTQKYVNTTLRHVTLIFEMAGTERITELDANTIKRCLFDLPGSQRTRKNHLLSLTSFFNYLKANGLWNRPSPTASVDIGRVIKTRPRRALNAEEIQALLQNSPQYRALVYRIALTTGLRRNELAQLKMSDVKFKSRSIYLRETITKNGKHAVQPIVESLVKPWRVWFKEGLKGLGGGVRGASVNAIRARFKNKFAVPTVPRVATLHADLERAGVVVENDLGIIDFHALRYTFGSQLLENGVDLEAVQKLMRHSSPVITANIYSVHGHNKRRLDVSAIDRLIE